MVLFLTVGLAGCTPDSGKPVRAAPVATPPQRVTILHAAGRGSPGRRLREFWKVTKKTAQADSVAGLGDSELQRRLAGVDEGWAELQIEFAGSDAPKEKQAYRAILSVRVYFTSVYGGKDDPPNVRRRVQNDRAYQKVALALAEDQIRELP